MRALIPIVAFASTVIAGMADPSDEFCIAIAQRVKAGRMSEIEAAAVFQKAIDQAKRELEAHKPPDAKTLERLLSSHQLTATILVAYSDGCTGMALEEVKFVRMDDRITVEVGKDGTPRKQSFTLSGEADAERGLADSFGRWIALVKQTAASPPPCKWLAGTTPEALLERGRRFRSMIGGFSYGKVAISLESPEGALKVIDETGTTLPEARAWHKELVSRVIGSAAKPPAAPAAR